ncbi:MAG: MBL fold metallo-hydrolase [Acidobacteria bacterium]|nr:MBL fold metallo-hydrolase [Acidobacteriota bacterium]
MKLNIFQSAQGDCLLLEGGDGTLVLCDGGMRSTVKSHVGKELAKLREAGRELEYVYVSHIDSDHISGVLQLLEDEVEWRVFEYQQRVGNPEARRPSIPRPPVIKGLLHNAFRDQIGVNSKDVEDLLAAAVPSLFATADPRLVDVALDLQEIAVSIPEAIKVSRLSAGDALDIPVNRLPGAGGPAKLLFFRDEVQSFDVGTMRFTIVGPGRRELTDLKTGWVNWLRASKEQVGALRAELKRRIEGFSNGVGGSPFDLRDWNGIPDYKGVTAPNIASLMFLVEEGGRRLLLTGDSQQDKILHGLNRAGVLGDEGVHLDVLKVQHHGSEHNLDANFARQVSARHYVFCGNGLHGNPSLEVIDCIFASRRGPAAVRTLAPAAAGEPFHFWFSTTAEAQEAGSARRRAFEGVEARVEELRQSAQGELVVHYNEGASIELAI